MANSTRRDQIIDAIFGNKAPISTLSDRDTEFHFFRSPFGYLFHAFRSDSTFTDQIPVSQIAKLPLDIVLFDLKEWKSACDDISEWKNVLYSAYFDLYE